ncbi:hypothetical protein BJ165DRAFT_1530549 [Panaeolus papilionaceus]|nr:hypothetical protein BJ165DRAFT_1530549 [Panaeolus papilionaceus]
MSSLKSLTLDLTYAQRRGFVALRYAEALPHLRSLESLLLVNNISCGRASSPNLNFIIDLGWFRNLKKLSFDWTIGASSPSDTPWDTVKVLKQTKAATRIRHVTITTTFQYENISPSRFCHRALSVQQWAEIDRLLAGSCFPSLNTVTIIFVAGIRKASALEEEEEYQPSLSEIENKINKDLRETLYATSKLVTVFEVKLVNNRISSRRTVPKTAVLNGTEVNDLAQQW